MSWLLFALLSAAIFGWVTVLDKKLISVKLPSLSSINLWVALSLFVTGLVFLAVEGFPAQAPPPHLVMAVVSGLAWGGALGLMFLGYKLEEASRATAVIHTFPVFVALLAMFVLDERLSVWEWAAILAVVAGAFSISLRFHHGGGLPRLNRAFPVLVGASLCTALGHLTGKYALEELSVWMVAALRNFGMVGVFVFLVRPAAFRQLARALRDPLTLAQLALAETILAPLSVVLLIMATQLGPVSLVATIAATRPVFVFLYTVFLSLPQIRWMDESMERSALLVKFASVLLIVGGVGVLTIF